MPKYRIFFIALSALTLSACNQPADDPRTVADKYWLNMQAGNISEAEKLVSLNSRQALPAQADRMASIAQLDNGKARTIVSTTITTINPDTNHRLTETFDTVLVMQQGEWKVDLNNTTIPPLPTASEEELQQLKQELSESMQENMESMDDAMSEGMEMLNEALQEGSKEMGDSLLRLMNELNSTMQESIEKMKERREQQMQQQEQPQSPQLAPQQAPEPDPRKGEGMI
jgi:flagellar biosynthesis/type III secretory pathway protein FliH